MTGFDPVRLAGLLRGGAELLESREKRLEFKARFGVATAEAVVKLLVRQGIDPELIELIKQDLEL